MDSNETVLLEQIASQQRIIDGLRYRLANSAELQARVDILQKECNLLRDTREELALKVERLRETHRRLKETIKELREKQRGKATDTMPKTLAGWSIQKSGGYYRAFRRVGGKIHGIHLGVTLEGAEQKINAKSGMSVVKVNI